MLTAPLSIRSIGDLPRYWARHSPTLPALWDQGILTTYAQLLAHISAGVNLLRARGVRRGDRVLIIAENCAAALVLFFAAADLSAWPIIVNARMSEREIEVIRSHSEPRIQLFTAAVSADAVAHATRAGATPAAEVPGVHVQQARDEPAAAPEDAVDQVATLIYTSGTTGSPKAVMVTHRGLLHFCEVSRQARALTPADCVYAALPFSHIFGIASIVLSTLYAGACLYIDSRFEAATALAAINSHRITALQGVPMMWRRLLAYLDTQKTKTTYPSLRYLYVGGGGLEPVLKSDIERAFGLPVHHGYGMTEYAGSMFVTRPDAPRSDCSSGSLNPGCEVRLVDERGSDVAPCQPGEIWIRGPGVMLGYYRAPELTREVMLPDGWLKTGDIGRLMPDGALFVVGRSKEVIKRSGFNVYPIEVESVLNSHPAVRLAGVIGSATPDGNEEVIAFIELEAGADLSDEELRAFLAQRLSPYKRPSRLLRVTALPVNANGKIRKHELAGLLT